MAIQPTLGGEYIQNQRYFFLGILSLVFCMSYLLTIFTPFPLALAILLYGRKKGYFLGIIGAIILAMLSQWVFHRGVVVYFYGLSLVGAGVVSEIILRKVHPLKGFFTGGFSLYLFIMLFIGGNVLMVEGGPTGLITREIEKASTELQKNKEIYQELQQNQETRELVDLLKKPETWAPELVRSFPFSLFMVLFFVLWVNLLLVLKGYRIFSAMIPTNTTNSSGGGSSGSSGSGDYPFSERDLLDFKVPEFLIWPFILAMLVYLLGGQWGADVAGISKNVLFCFGLFYFFQGLGIFMELLRALRISGFFGTLLIVLTVVTSYWPLALIGLFDLWFDFRNMIQKKIDRR